MSDWSAGYVTEVGYPYGYYRDLTPHNLALAALSKGIAAPGLDGGPVRVLELGCGQGYSANLIAAANPAIDYTAIDFNPAHIAGAAALAREAGTKNVRFSEASFEDFADDKGEGPFDIITLHGVYSWVSAEHRAQVIRIAREKLRPGGILYVSYNCYPGWASSVPIHRLFADVAAGSPYEPVDVRIANAFQIFKVLGRIGARCLEANPAVVERFSQLEQLPVNYLAHELLNANWTIFHSADVNRDMAQAKLTFVGSARILDHLDPLNLTDTQQLLLNQVKDPMRRESLRDLIVNQEFRRDIFIKGASDPAASPLESWRSLRFALAARARDVPLKIKGQLAEATLAPETYGALLEQLDLGPASLAQLIALPKFRALGLAVLQNHLLMLLGQGTCQLALSDQGGAERMKSTDSFNRAILARARRGADYGFLASPVTGAGVGVDRVGQLALLAMHEGVYKREDFIAAILKDNPATSTSAGPAPRESLREGLAHFDEKILPILKRLGILTGAAAPDPASKADRLPRAPELILHGFPPDGSEV
ncbi:MAG: class I SAM-dependent methyltransferase [Methylocella sp.]